MIEVVRHPDAEQGHSFAPLLLSWLHYYIPSPVRDGQYLESEPLPDQVIDFLYDYCATNAAGRSRLHAESAVVYAKGCDKSGLAAMAAIAELFGPSQPCGIAQGGETYDDGTFVYVYQPGDVMAVRRHQPHVAVLATTKEQAEKTCYSRVWKWLGGASVGASQRLIEAFGIDPHTMVGRLRYVGADGATIRVLAAEHGAASADGGRETLVIADESHRMVGSVVDTLRALTANLGKRGGNCLHSTTIYAHGEDSALEQLFDLVADIKADLTPLRNVLVHHAIAPADADWTTTEGVYDAIAEVYEVAPWVDVEPIVAKFFDRREDAGNLKRLYAGVPSTPSTKWLDYESIASMTAGHPSPPPLGSAITLGLDASHGVSAHSKYFADCTALVASSVPHTPGEPKVVWPIKIWTPRSLDWQLNYDELAAEVSDTFARYRVVGFFADPPRIEQLIAQWEKRFGRRLVAKAKRNNPIGWSTARYREMGEALVDYESAILDGEIAMVSDPVLIDHHKNAHRRVTRSGYILGKERHHSNAKIDATIAACLAVTAANEAIRGGAARHTPTSSTAPRIISF